MTRPTLTICKNLLQHRFKHVRRMKYEISNYGIPRNRITTQINDLILS